MVAAFLAGVEAVSLYGGATVGSRTVLDALTPTSIELYETGSLKQAALKAHEGADSTTAMTVASAGRSNYLSEETLIGTPDPVALAIVMEYIADDEL
jgi:triose/dihydroxyacetone kinase / FAD-AMP lyase (cyclizing)